MLHLISYLILKRVDFSFHARNKFHDFDIVKFINRNGTRYVIHEREGDLMPTYDIMEWEDGKLVASHIYAIEAIDVVAALV